MSKQKVVFKYGTGHPVPPEAKYLCTKVETVSETEVSSVGGGVAMASKTTTRNVLVWHYYELMVEAEGKEKRG